jgi:tRNA A37 threonylcarbamoyladenosine dehydratase
MELMSAQLEQIRVEMEEARREAASRQQRNEHLARQERHRFVIRLTVSAAVTSIAGLTAAATLILHLMGRL